LWLTAIAEDINWPTSFRYCSHCIFY